MIEKGFQACHVADGQQRLTTFVILLNEIVCFVRTLDDWYSSRESSSAKRIVCRHEAAVIDPGEQEAIFDWMIRTLDSLMDALAFAGVWER